MEKINKKFKPILMGGVGEKLSNGGTQYYEHRRVYSSLNISTSICSGQTTYLVLIYKDKKNGLVKRKDEEVHCQ